MKYHYLLQLTVYMSKKELRDRTMWVCFYHDEKASEKTKLECSYMLSMICHFRERIQY